MGTWRVFGLLLVISVNAAAILRSKFPEVTQDNFEQHLKEKKCMFLYGTKQDCKMCHMLYSKFITVSQTFADEPDIFFGQFSDKALAESFGIERFPAIVFYEFGSADPKTYLGDITAAALTEIVAKASKTNSKKLDKKYAVELTKSNFDDIIGNDQQYRLVMLHEEDDLDDIDDFDDLAKIFDNDHVVVFARINVDAEKYLDNKYFSTVYPAFYWYTKGTVDKKKQYGGQLKIDQMKSFINQKCGLHRTREGRLDPFAGLIQPLDEVINKHGTNLYKVVKINDIIKDVKKAIKKLPKTTDKELIDYYLYLLDELEEDGTIESLSESRGRLFRQMDSAGPLGMDHLFRKRNIVSKFIDIIGKHMLEDLSNGEVGVDKDIPKDYITASGASNHGIEFHEEF